MLGSLDLAAALLLGAAGVGKLRSPVPAVATLRRAVPRRMRAVAAPGTVRFAGAAELAVAAGVALDGGRAALLLLAAAYVVFLAVSARLARAGSSTSCGCFGASDSPIGTAHLVLNAVAAGVAVGGIVRPAGPWGGLARGDALPAAVGLAQAGLLAALAYLSITALPALAADRRRAAS